MVASGDVCTERAYVAEANGNARYGSAAPESKLCSRCNQVKPTSAFCKFVYSTDGLQAWCKQCKREQPQKKLQAEEAAVRSRLEQVSQQLWRAKQAACAHYARHIELQTRLQTIEAQLQLLHAFHNIGTQRSQTHPAPASASPSPSLNRSDLHVSQKVPVLEHVAQACRGDREYWGRAGEERVRKGVNPLFSKHAAPAWERFRQHVVLRPSHVFGAPGTEVDVEAFRRGVARRLQCSVPQVCWWIGSESFPEATESGEISSHFGTAVCFAKMQLIWGGSLVQSATLLAYLERLDAARAAQTVTPTHFDAHPLLPSAILQRLADTPADSASAKAFDAPPPPPAQPAEQRPGVSQDVQALSQRLFAKLQITRDRSIAVARGAAAQPPADDVQGFHTLSLRIYSRLLDDAVRLLAPADALGLCQRVCSSFTVHEAPEAAVQPDSLAAMKYVSASNTAARTAAEAAARFVRTSPREPVLPTSALELQREEERCLQQLRAVQADVALAFSVALLDASHALYLVKQATNPSALGVVKFEEVNVKAYHALQLSTRQKQALVLRWRAYQQHTRQLHDSWAPLLQRLFTLSADTSVPDSPDSPRNAHGQAPPNPARPWPTRPEPTCGVPAAPNPDSCLRNMLGANPDAADRAGRVLAQLRRHLRRSSELYVHYMMAFHSPGLLTVRQCATYLSCTMPLVADVARLAEMASDDLKRDRVFG